MTWLRTSEMVNPQLLGKYFSEQTVAKNAFVRSGIIENSAELSAMIAAGGLTGKLPFYKMITGDDEVLSDASGEALTVNGTSTASEIYAVLARGKAFGASDLAKAFSGDDPMKALGDMISDYWTTKMSTTLISSLTGLFLNSSMSGLVHDISGGSTAATRMLTASNAVDAFAKLGDNASKITAIAVHSATMAVLQKEQLITYLRNAEYNIEMPTYLGKLVIVDDSLPVSGGTYTSYAFTPGAVVYGGNSAPVSVEYDRDSLAGVDILVTRYHYVLHPRGTSITVSGIAGATPSNTELATDIWSRVFELKNCGIIQIKHKNA